VSCGFFGLEYQIECRTSCLENPKEANDNFFNRFLVVSLILCVLSIQSYGRENTAAVLRAPATPLIVHDPYFSIWSTGDGLSDGPTRHWSGVPQPLTETQPLAHVLSAPGPARNLLTQR
jgi:Domain of unknown function (DUF4964)